MSKKLIVIITGEQVRMARAGLNWSLKMLAERSGITGRTITHIEKGRHRLHHPATQRRIREAFEGAGAKFIGKRGVRLAEGAGDEQRS